MSFKQFSSKQKITFSKLLILSLYLFILLHIKSSWKITEFDTLQILLWEFLKRYFKISQEVEPVEDYEANFCIWPLCVNMTNCRLLIENNLKTKELWTSEETKAPLRTKSDEDYLSVL